MDKIIPLIIGIFVGAVAVAIMFAIKSSRTSNKANKIIENAKKEAEKNKRDALLELKQESLQWS